MMKEIIIDCSKPNYSELLSEEELKNWLGVKRRATLRRCLLEKNIQFFESIGKRICTTTTAVNMALENKLNFEVEFS